MLTLRHCRAGRWPFLILAACVWIGRTDSALAQDGQKQVLVLFSTGRDAQVSILSERELPRILDRGLGRSLDYYSEFIDSGRFPDPHYQAAFRDFLRLKYRGRRFDAVIAMLDVAAEFLAKNREDLFPGTPVISFASSAVADPGANATGVIDRMDYSRTLALARTLQPDITQVFVVGGAGSRDKILLDRALEQFRPYEAWLRITYLAGLPTKELERRLASLPEHSIIYYLLTYQDGAGQLFQPVDYLDRLAAVANRPIYSWVDSTMGHGIVGGSMRQLQKQIDAVADVTIRVLHGQAADSIPRSFPDLNVDQIDWRQIRRWGISEANVPAGTTVLFREPSAWDRFKVYILGAVALVVAQTALIVGLLVQGARRRQAEDMMRRSQAELRKSYDRIRDLGGRLLSAQEAERSRIARELHDDVSQQLARLAIDLGLLSGDGRVHRGDASKLAHDALDRARSVAVSVHDLSHRLHPAKLRLLGLVAALGSLQEEFSQSGTTVAFTYDNVPTAVPHDLALCLFRIVQEALQNGVKHGAARHITIRLDGTPEGLDLTIVDDGVGFDVDAVRDGIGLISMAERLEPLGGVLEIHSRVGAGTRLQARVPFRFVHAPGRPSPSNEGRVA
jgi:signal transduction histidine kinase